MKNIPGLTAIFTLAALLTAPVFVQAGTYTKADNTNSLDQAVSWGGVAPGGGDIAKWAGVYSADVTSNSLAAPMPGSALAWQGLTVGAISGTALTTNTIAAAETNITAATETVVNGFNLVTITTKANHGFEPGQAVTIAGVTPAEYNGTYLVAGVPSATQFTYTNAIGSLAAATAFGTVSSAIYIGGAGAAAAGSALTIGSAGIDLSAANVSVVINNTDVSFSGDQQWKVASGAVLRFSDGGVTAASARVLNSGNDGLIRISGGGIVSLNEGGGSGFADANSFAAFTGSWQVDRGATLRGLRSGGDAWGSGTLTLNGGTLSDGGMSGDVGGWTWNNPIVLNSGTTSAIAEHIVTGTGRYLNLSGSFSGSGNLVFTEPLVGATTFTSMDGGFILCGDWSGVSGGTITIGGPVENGVSNRLTYVRVGGTPPSNSNQSGAGASGSLGEDNIVNNGVLTFTLTTALSVPGQISGTGALRVGSTTTSSAFVGDAYQNIILNGVNPYTGPTIINAGTLTLAPGTSIANSSGLSITANTVNGGAVINTFDVSQLTGGFTPAPGQTLAFNGGQVYGTLNLAAGSTNLFAPGGSNVVGTFSISGDLNLSGGNNTLVLDINNAANDQVLVGGNLTAGGVTTLQFVPPPTGLNAGTYTLLTANGTVNATPANFSIAGLAAGARPQTFNIAINGNTVQLVVVGSPGNLTWQGDGAANVWSTATTFSNWLNNVTSARDIFVQNDQVTFDDSGSASPAINLTGTLAPSSVTINGSQNYTLDGSGQIAGATGLTINDFGTVTLNNSNSFTGPVMVNYGVVAITNEAALGEPTNYQSASLTLDNGGALLIPNTQTLGINTNRGILIGAGGGAFNVADGATLTISNVIGDLGGVSVLTKNGNGALILSGNNNYGNGGSISAATVINGGTVIYGSAAGLSRGANTSGTSGFFVPPFELDGGAVDINGQISYQPNFTGGTAATGIGVMLYSGTLNFNGASGAPLLFRDSGATPSGWGSASATVLNYNEGNNPGTLTISARFAAVGTSGSSSRAFYIGDSAATATEVDITAPMGVSSLDSTNQDGRNITIVKTGAGTLQISAVNNFPILQVDQGILRVNHPQALGVDRSGSTGVSGGSGSPHQLIVDGGTVDLNGFSPAIGALNDNGATTGLILNNGASASVLTLGYSLSNAVNNASYTSIIADGAGAVSLVKIGTNTQTLAGINTYSGLTTVANGTLLINGQIGLGAAASAVTVTGGALGGAGIINAPVVVQSGGTFAPGATAASPVTLTLTTNLTLNGTNIFNVNKDLGTNDFVLLTHGTVNYGGVLIIATNQMTATTLALGDSFQLFSAPAHTGNFTLIGSPGAGWSWSFNPASGVVSVVNGFASNPTNLTAVVSGGTMTISWPADHLGWILQAQTNALSSGLNGNWVDVPGSDAGTQAIIPINPANPTVFYRLRRP
jgi:autotransporter-associated beta strand protein